MAARDWTRRDALAGLAALAPGLACAQPAPFAPAFDQARTMAQLQSLVIAQSGRIVEAEAIRGPVLKTPVNVKSVSKSLVSALTGIAIQRREIESTETPVAPLLRRAVPRRVDPRVHEITVGDMLSMRSGLREVSGAAYGDWVGSKHWIYEALRKPMVAEPGTEMLYSTASYHVLGAVLTNVSRQDLHTLARDRLGVPLGIQIPRWTQDPQGRFVGGNDMRISPLAMVRFGEMYRQGGLWEGARLLTEDWVARSWTPYGQSKETGHGYGYGWFIWRARGHDLYYARGYGGQVIAVVPALELTVAITSDPRRPATADGYFGALLNLISDAVLPAAEA